MIKDQSSRKNRGKWLILLIFFLSCAAILPLSWQAIQAQRAQQKTMNALKKSIGDIAAALKSDRCSGAMLASANALVTQARSVEGVFPRLSQAPGEFAQLSRALIRNSEEFRAQVKIENCQALSVRLPELKKRCDACHELFNPQRKQKLD